jgi:excisionase family DNA binding protein
MLTTAQAAKLLRLSPRQVREHAEAGRLPAVKFGARAWMFRRADVEAFTPDPPGRPPSSGQSPT